MTARTDPEGEDYRRFIDSDRRVSPAGLRDAPYHRARWALKLPFCPESWEILVQRCPGCDEALGWHKTLRVELCDRCGFDLRGATTSLVPKRRRKWLAWLAALIDPNPSRRSPAGLILPAQLNECSSIEVFRVAMAFARTTAALAGRQAPTVFEAVKGGAQHAADMAAGMEILARYPASFDDKKASGNVKMPRFFKLAKLRAGQHCTHLVRALCQDWEPCAHGPSRLRAEREGAGQLTLREAARKLQIENRALRTLIDFNLIGAPHGRGVVRNIQWLEPEIVSDAGRRIHERMSPLECSQTYKIPRSAVGQLVSLGLLNLNRDPIVKQLHPGPQLHRSAVLDLASRLLALRHVSTPAIALWPLEDVFHGIGAQEKPWGVILRAALQREIVLYCDDQISGHLHISKLQIAQGLAHEILARQRPELLLVPEAVEPGMNEVSITRVEAESYLNCFPRDLSWLIAEGNLSAQPHRREVAELGQRLISSREISWRWRVSPSFREAMAEDRGIKRTAGPFWSRAEVEGYFAEVFPAGRPI